ncbi:MAG: RNB domain-containing ribonuclease [Burkholderiaceae bacterium]|nr:MAG: RNB domain-containing ribonuclease [Burkholderiaceae bacterium]
MYVLFDSAGKFLAGRILSETDASAQVELDSGKRVKVKLAHQLLHFDAPAGDALVTQATNEAAGIDPALAWEFAPAAEFGFQDLARDYFGGTPTAVQQAAALIALQAAPHYFRRAGSGRFRKAPADIVAQALAAIEKKKQIAAQVSAWAGELAAGQCPAPIREQLYKILFKPDKNAPEYKAVVEAARSTKSAPLALLTHAGAITSAYQFHWQRFLFENFPRGTGFPELHAPASTLALPEAPVQAFSIDDNETTEIDDALSVQGLGSGAVTVGIHIAAPGLAIQPGDALDQVCRERLSTVYMPGYKITMLPADVVDTYTLLAGRANPALSLYVTLDEATLEIKATETRLERVPVEANLRHEALDDDLSLTDPSVAPNGANRSGLPASLPTQLQFLYRLAEHLKAQREQVRGKPLTFTRPDYSFHLSGHAAGAEPTGEERVAIHTRARGAPLDLVVSELMILTNDTWGGWLKALGVPGIYRSQSSLAPGVKVRMGTKPAPHAGMGVAHYAWSTSPLRRYVDLVNQWQLIAAVQHDTTAALAAPFKPRDTELLAIVSAFDATYAAYARHQAGMERFWALRYLEQEGIRELPATLIKEQAAGIWLVRADNLPLVFPVMGAQSVARGMHVQIQLGGVDLIALDVHGTVTTVLQPESAEGAADNEGDADETESAGPVALALSVDEPDAGAEPATP